MVHIFDKQGLRVIGVGLMLGMSSYIHGEPSNINDLKVVNDRVITFEGFRQFHGLAPLSPSSADAFFRLNNPSIVTTTSHDDVQSLSVEIVVNQWLPNNRQYIGFRQIISSPNYSTLSSNNENQSYNIECQVIHEFGVLNDHLLYHLYYSSNSETRAGPVCW